MSRPHCPLKYAAVLLLAVCAPVGAEPDPAAIQAEIGKLDWIGGPGAHQLERLNAAYLLEDQEAIVVNDDARRYMELTEGTDQFADTDFVVLHDLDAAESAGMTQTMYTHQDIGYVDDGDWPELDDDSLLEQIRTNTESANADRRSRGHATVAVEGWRSRPQYDREGRVAFWALDIRTSEGGSLVNATAIKLSRDGFTVITWAGAPGRFHGEQTLAGIGESFVFQEGHRYADYREGDAVAGVGLAALAAGLAKRGGWQGAAAGGAMAVIIAFAKKLWWLAILPFLWIGRRFFGARKNETG